LNNPAVYYTKLRSLYVTLFTKVLYSTDLYGINNSRTRDVCCQWSVKSNLT